MKIWVSGCKGMLGRAFCRLLGEMGIDFIGSDREVDITGSKEVARFLEGKGFTHLINCAAYTAVDLAEEEQEKAYQLNVKGVETLATLAKKNNIKMIHFSTDYVFDGRAKRPYFEDDPTNPLSIYGKTKREGEEILLSILPSSLMIRSSWLFGREGNHFVKTICRLIREREEIKVINDQWGRPTFCDDLVKISLELLDESGIFHVANQGETTWYEWAEEIRTRVGGRCQKVLPVTTKEFSHSAKRPPYSVLGTSKVEKTLVTTIPHWKERLDAII